MRMNIGPVGIEMYSVRHKTKFQRSSEFNSFITKSKAELLLITRVNKQDASSRVVTCADPAAGINFTLMGVRIPQMDTATRDSDVISELPLMQLILAFKISCIWGSSEIPKLSLTATTFDFDVAQVYSEAKSASLFLILTCLCKYEIALAL